MYVWGIIVLSVIGLVSAQLPVKDMAKTNKISNTSYGTSMTVGKFSSVFRKPSPQIPSLTPWNLNQISSQIDNDKRKNHLKLGSFNIQSFGRAKLNKPKVVAALVQIISTYDIVVIQEIKMETELFKGFINTLNQFVK